MLDEKKAREEEQRFQAAIDAAEEKLRVPRENLQKMIDYRE